jgi:ubiquinone biosynthesis protein
MVSMARTPTRLIDPSQRRAVVVETPRRPSRWHSLVVVCQLLWLGLRLIGLRMRRELTPTVLGRELRAQFERWGGLWIKTGQLLALRVDLFPIPMCDELAKLQNNSVGFPPEVARQIIESELGAPIEAHFDEFGAYPFAVASIGQVFRAHLRQENAWVAVKVQRPYMDELFRRDFAVVHGLVWLLRVFRLFRHMRWDLGLQELRELMDEELNYQYEASNIRRMRTSLRSHKISVPKLIERYCTRRVLVTEFIHGVLMADYIAVARSDPQRLAAWRRENNIDPRRIARRLMYSLFQQMLEDNLYHGDLHPGNIVLLRDNRIALIDFGTASFTEREYLERFKMFVRALAARDYSKAADLCFMLAARVPNIDLEPVKEKLVNVLRAWARRTLVRELPYHTKSLENVTVSLARITVGYRCTMEWAWLRMHRAFTTLDLSLVHLYPDVNYSRILQKYFERAEVRSLQTMVSGRMVLRSLGSYRTALDIQDRVNEYTMFQGQLVRRQAQLFEGATDKFAAFLAAVAQILAVCLCAFNVIVLYVFASQHHPSWVRALAIGRGEALTDRFPNLSEGVWILSLLLLWYVFFRLTSLVRVLRRKDVQRGQRVVAV